MADYLESFKSAFGEVDSQQFVLPDDATPIGIANFFNGVFFDLLQPFLSLQVGQLSDSTFLEAAVAEYEEASRDGWKSIIPPYIADLNTVLFIPRMAALPPPAPPTISPPLQGTATQLYTTLLSKCSDPGVAAKFTNSLFNGIFNDLIVAGLALPVKPVTVSPYIPVPT
jgi:hypothetical protein